MKEANLKRGYILYDSNYMILWKSQNYGDGKKFSGCWKLGGRERGMNLQSTRGF